MKKNSKIAVIGCTGKSGKYLVRALLKEGYKLKALVRNPEKDSSESHLLEVVHGSVSDFTALQALLKGCEAVISTLGMGVPPSEPPIFSTSPRHVLR